MQPGRCGTHVDATTPAAAIDDHDRRARADCHLHRVGRRGGGGAPEQIRYTPAGQSAARAALLTQADLSTTVGWMRKAYKPDIAAVQVGCGSFRPRVSDLVLIGAAGVSYSSRTSPSVDFDSLVEVLRTPHMVDLDWQRSIESPHAIGCLAAQAKTYFASSATFVSMRPLAFAPTGTHIAGWRAELATKTRAKIHFVYDIVIATRGRTEMTLSSTAAIESASLLKATEGRLIARLVARVRT